MALYLVLWKIKRVSEEPSAIPNCRCYENRLEKKETLAVVNRLVWPSFGDFGHKELPWHSTVTYVFMESSLVLREQYSGPEDYRTRSDPHHSCSINLKTPFSTHSAACATIKSYLKARLLSGKSEPMFIFHLWSHVENTVWE